MSANAPRRTVRNATLWTLAGSFALIGVIIVVSAWGQTPRGESIIENPGALIGGVIAGLGTLMGVIMPAVLRAERNSEELKEQVKNDHKKEDGTPLLLRDDLDDKHEQVLHQIALVTHTLKTVEGGLALAIELSRANAADVRGIRHDIGRLNDDVRENTRETRTVSRVATGLVQTVGTLEGEVAKVKATIDKHHPKESNS